MKKWICTAAGVLAVLFGLSAGTMEAAAKESADETIHDGIYIGEIEVSGMKVAEAEEAVEGYIEGLKEIPLTLYAAAGQSVETTVGDLGIKWANPQAAEDAFELGRQGNIIRRFKALQDLARENKKYKLELAFDKEAIHTIVAEQCTQYDVAAQNASLRREGGSFVIEGGETGEAVDVEASAKKLEAFLKNEWDRSGEEAALVLEVKVTEPKGKKEDLEKVKDVLGTYTTSYKTSGSSRSANVSNGCELINGTTVYPGEEFSTYKAVSPFSEDNGYHMAGSYLNGMVVESLGGGICQVSTTLYNTVLRAEMEVTERHNHSMEVSYVDPSADAAIAESAGKDFRFVNNTEYPIYIEGYTADKTITFTIYGVESRDPGRKISFESEILSETKPDADTVIADGSQPVGYVKVQSVHVGRKAKLWKVITENGEEVGREEINTSSYKMVPRTATVGTATSDPVASQLIQAAIATNNIDHIKGVAASLKAGDLTLGGTLLPAAGAVTEEPAASDAADALAP